MDYANKQWAGKIFVENLACFIIFSILGVISKYFQPRWQKFISYANSTLSKAVPFNKTFIKREIFAEVEEPFTFDRSTFPNEPQGDFNFERSRFLLFFFYRRYC